MLVDEVQLCTAIQDALDREGRLKIFVSFGWDSQR